MASAATHGDGAITDAVALRAFLALRVKGQDHILGDLSTFLAERVAQPRSGRPLASLCFIGGNEDGKTTLANAIAEYLYGAKGAVRYDGSELGGPDAKGRLIGVPTGYLGYDRGGQVTAPLIENSARVILFEHFERVHPSIWPVLFQVLTEGKLVEPGTVRTADFSRAIVILMSKATRTGFYETFSEIPDAEKAAQEVIERWSRNPENPEEPFRSGILERVEKTYVFRPLSDAARIEILSLKAAQIVKSYGLDLAGVDPRFLADLAGRFSFRECERVLDDRVGEGLICAKEAGWEKVRIDFTEGTAVVSRDQ